MQYSGNLAHKGLKYIICSYWYEALNSKDFSLKKLLDSTPIGSRIDVVNSYL